MFIHIRIAAVAILLSTAFANAAEPPLALNDAVALAVSGSPQLQSRQAAVDAARSMAVSAGRLPDPEIMAGIENLPSEGMDAWSVGRDSMTMRKVGVMQTFPNRVKRRAERQAAQASINVATTGATQTELELKQSVAQAWIARQLAERSVETLSRLKSQLLLQSDLTRTALAAGRIPATDAVAAQAQVALVDDQMLEARQTLIEATAELARWIGDAAQRPLASPPPFTELPASASELMSSLHHHAALVAYDARIAAARTDIAVANAARRPDWSTELDYALRGRGYSNMISLQVQVSLPLFPGSRQDPAIAAKRAVVKQLEAEREDELRMHTAEITRVLGAWQSGTERLQLFERERLPLARQRSELALEGLRSGRMALRETLPVLAEQIEVERIHIELLGMQGRSWAWLRYQPAAGDRP